MSQSFENLKIWKDSVLLAEFIYKETKKFPKDECFGMVSQMRRAVVSISSNIAEGSSRPSKKDFCRFVDIALGSLKELESLVHISVRLGYTDKQIAKYLFDKISEVGLSIGGFRKYLIK